VADLDIDLDGDSARFTQHLTLSLYAEGWRTVPLSPLGTFVDADFGGLEGRIVTEPETALRIRGKGRHRVRLISVLPVERDELVTRHVGRLGFVTPAAAVVRGRLNLPEGADEVRVTGPVAFTDDRPRGRGFTAGSGQTVGFDVHRSSGAPGRESLPLRFESRAAVGLVVGRNARNLRAEIQIRVLQGQLSSIELPLPPGFEVEDVTLDDATGWRVEDGVLRVTPGAPAEGRLRVAVTASAGPGDTFDLAPFVPAGSRSSMTVGHIAVEGDGLLELLDLGDARAPESQWERQLAQRWRGIPGQAFVLAERGRPPRWRVEWAESTDVLAAQVDHLWLEAFVGEDGRALYRLWAEVRSTGAPLLTLELPTGSELLTASREGLGILPGEVHGAWGVPLTSNGGSQRVHLTALVPIGDGLRGGDRDRSIALPMPKLSAPVARIEVRTILRSGAEYSLARPERAGKVSAPPSIYREAPTSQLGQQLARFVAVPVGGGFLDPGDGFEVVEAAWNAMAPNPEALRVEVNDDNPRKEWF
ncbi:MAG: hypothetical protein AAGD06_27365, partial [Acidobacteriota bacterium]